MTKFHVVLLSFSLLLSSLAQANDNSPNIERINWKKVITAKTVKVDNPIGDIRLRFGGYKNEIEIIAMVQHNEVEGKLEIVEKEDGGVYHLGMRRVDHKSGKELSVDMGDKSRIDFTLYVPLGRTTYAESKNGLIEARKMRDPVHLSSKTGNIFLRDNKNIVLANTNTGEITANLIPIASQETQQFTTLSGAIDIWMAENTPLTVIMSTSGDIISDYSTTIKRDMSKEPNKEATVLSNGGGAKIIAESKIGTVAFKAIPVQ